MKNRIETRNGRHVVITHQDGPNYFYSVLCREERDGELRATHKTGSHSTKKGALRWAAKQVGF